MDESQDIWGDVVFNEAFQAAFPDLTEPPYRAMRMLNLYIYKKHPDGDLQQVGEISADEADAKGIKVKHDWVECSHPLNMLY